MNSFFNNLGGLGYLDPQYISQQEYFQYLSSVQQQIYQAYEEKTVEEQYAKSPRTEENVIEGECEDITDKRALPDLKD